jgi:hypothetical protein
MMTSKFKKGVSGNPAGRPAGKTPGARLRKAIEARSVDILKTVIDSAVAGDISACKILLDRITPTLKATALPISLPGSDTLAGQGNEVIKAIIGGSIPPDIGSYLITALANQSKIIEIDVLTKRIEALENKR